MRKLMMTTAFGAMLVLGACGDEDKEEKKSPEAAAKEWCECVAENDKDYSNKDCKKLMKGFMDENKGKEDVLKKYFAAQEECRGTIINKE